MAGFCSRYREKMVKFQAVKIIALESVDFFREWNCLDKHKQSDSMSRVVEKVKHFIIILMKKE